jgi:hypothetical protein
MVLRFVTTNASAFQLLEEVVVTFKTAKSFLIEDGGLMLFLMIRGRLERRPHMPASPVAMQQLFRGVALVRSRPRRLRNGNETTRTLARPGRSHSMGVAGRRLGP